MSSSAASTSSSSAAASSSAASGTLTVGSNLKIVGIILAVCSGLLIGSSFVFKKKGLLRSQAGQEAGEGVAYLKSPLWWTGMIMMILGELCNFAAYAFIEALVVTPLGALSVVICAILSSIFLKEKLSFFGWIGCTLSILGSIIIALNGPQEATVGQITAFQALFLAPGFLAYGGTLIFASLVIIFYFAPKYGKKSMLWYISVCSMIGGISVSVTTGLGAAIVTTAMGDNQFNHWFIYFLLIFIAVTLITEVYYLNVALALFNTAMVTPTYYVIFSFCSMITTVVLFQGLKASASQILTIVMAFLVICCGITILQMSKVDPTQLKNLDRRSTMLLQAARQNTEKVDEKDITGIEDPGIDAIRGSSGLIGSIIRAKTARRMSQSTRSVNSTRSNTSGFPGLPVSASGGMRDGLQRHQLYDRPMPTSPDTFDQSSMLSTPSHKPTIKFGSQDVVHEYIPTSAGASADAIHIQREASYNRPTSSLIPQKSPVLPTVNENSSPILSVPPFPGSSLGLSRYDTESMERYGPRSAPPVIYNDTIHHPLAADPYDVEVAPATSYGSSFVDVGKYPQYSDTDDPERTPSTRHQTRNAHGRSQSQQQSGKRRNRSRTTSERHYPRTGTEDDREESISLVDRPSLEESDDNDSFSQDQEHDDDMDSVRGRGGIRLVAPVGRRI